ncbi:MAG: aldose epimerase family protein [Phycisphaerae bacterium]
MSDQQVGVQEGYSLTSPGGLALRAIARGATVTHLWAPDRWGRQADLVLGFADDAQYGMPHPYFGVMAGRVAGRISGARFELNGRPYPLARNDPPNHLHGGVRGFDKQIWQGEKLDEQSVRFTRVSPDGEEGYPGRVEVQVTYTVSAGNAFIVDVEATTDAATPFSLTHHSYFNLAGEASGESVEGHELEIVADDYAPADGQMGLMGKRERVTSGNDFRRRRLLSEAIPQLHAQHGDLYFVRREAGVAEPVPAARLVHVGSGRVMSVSTTEDCIQLYTGVGLDGTLRGKSGRAYGRHAGLCLECEGYPDGANTPALGDVILRPGEKAIQRTIYAFSTV